MKTTTLAVSLLLVAGASCPALAQGEETPDRTHDGCVASINRAVMPILVDFLGTPQTCTHNDASNETQVSGTSGVTWEGVRFSRYYESMDVIYVTQWNVQVTEPGTLTLDWLMTARDEIFDHGPYDWETDTDESETGFEAWSTVSPDTRAWWRLDEAGELAAFGYSYVN